jgi:DNA-directed RNA polymerase specialized sigma24 family protein
MVRFGRDPAPIEPLFRAHFDAIFRYAAYRIGRDAALDVASETFAQALKASARSTPSGMHGHGSSGSPVTCSAIIVEPS